MNSGADREVSLGPASVVVGMGNFASDHTEESPHEKAKWQSMCLRSGC